MNFKFMFINKLINTATLKINLINGDFQRFSTADLYQFTTETPSERFPFIFRLQYELRPNFGHLKLYSSI
jgi:hypothetical protein